MISQNALRHAEKCRFCWMCRHMCPVQRQTGREINTPRAKGLLLSMARKGARPFDRDMAQAMYECLLCEACTNDCATGYRPPLFIREARTEAVVSETAPSGVMKLIDNVLESGNIYGVERPSFGRAGTDILLYIGEVAAVKVPEMAENLLKLLEQAGVSARVLDREPPSGAMLGDLMGYTEEVCRQAKDCAAAINAQGLPVVVLDSYDAEIMVQQYPAWGCEIQAGVTTATALIARLLEEGRLERKPVRNVKGACHDDDRLARAFHEFAPIRAIAEAAGYEAGEMFQREKLARSCGNALAYAYMPELVSRIAAERWRDLERTDCTAMLVAGPQAYLCLSSCVPEGYRLVDLFGALGRDA